MYETTDDLTAKQIKAFEKFMDSEIGIEYEVNESASGDLDEFYMVIFDPTHREVTLIREFETKLTEEVMTNTDFELFKMGIFTVYREQLAHNEKLFADAEHKDHSKIEKYHEQYMERTSTRSDTFEDESADTIVGICTDFIEECKDYDKFPRYSCSCEVASSFERDDGESFMRATWWTPKKFNEHTAKNLVRTAFAKELAPTSRKSYPATVDCKMMALFKDGTITFEALRKLVYSDCDL